MANLGFVFRQAGRLVVFVVLTWSRFLEFLHEERLYNSLYSTSHSKASVISTENKAVFSDLCFVLF